MLKTLVTACSIACIAAAAKSHEFWIDPTTYQIGQGDVVTAHLRVGQDFEGASQSYVPRNFERFEAWDSAGQMPVPGVVGDRPAVSMAAGGEGLLVLVHETTDSFITWSTWEKFENFLVHKDAEWVMARHDALEFSREKVREAYSRYAKSLVAVGHGEGSDQKTGLLTEFVALENPYVGDVSDGFDVQVLFEGKPRENAQIEVFEKSESGEVTIFLIRADAEGRASVPVKPGHRYMLDAVVLRRATGEQAERDALWESLWANLTFEVPAN